MLTRQKMLLIYIAKVNGSGPDGVEALKRVDLFWTCRRSEKRLEPINIILQYPVSAPII
jgi:hypothetical protein